MCGIAGFFDPSLTHSADDLRRTAMRMADTLRHRGPNHGGAWADAASGIALSMRRLAILDLSPAGEQPMQSIGGRYVIVFNGEIYNYNELRSELAREYAFRGSSDTEVVLAAFEKWGIESSMTRFNGMFALAVWDREERSLTLARDRFGEKPLYYARSGQRLIFGSELKALRAHPDFTQDVHVEAVALFLRYSCVPSPYSIYQDTYKLPPATTLKITGKDFSSQPKPYWSMRGVVDEGLAHPLPYSEQEAIDALDVLLKECVRMRMHSDVPLGAFLSGGIDSSTVVALMQAQSNKPVRTFSIGNQDKELDEAREAARIAHHLGTEHTELYVTPDEAMAVIPLLPDMYDEPFADCSQIPTYLVSRLARQQVTVSLSGDGGDELFGGYSRHIWAKTLDSRLKQIPFFMRRMAAAGVRSVSPSGWDSLFQAGSSLLPAGWRQRMPGYKLHKLASLAESRETGTLYERLASHWLSPEAMLAGDHALSQTHRRTHAAFQHPAEEMMYLDTVGYLPDDILVKLDRATMAVSLEGRAPFLDHRLAEFAWRLPLSMKVRQREGKWILRQLLYRYVPQEMVDRPKSGFGIPLATWLRGSLRPWAESLLSEDRLKQDGYFNPRPIRTMWREHLSGKLNWEYHLWDVLMFQAWLEKHRNAPARLHEDAAAFPNTVTVRDAQ